KIATVRLLLALAAHLNLEIEQMDVITAFLCGNLQERIIMKLLSGHLSGKKYCILQRTLYGLKQSPREWYAELTRLLEDMGFIQKEATPDSTPMENGGISHKEDHGPKLEGHEQRLYREMVGSLMYTLCTRPDCAFSTSTLGQYSDKSTQTTWKAGLRVLKNLKG